MIYLMDTVLTCWSLISLISAIKFYFPKHILFLQAKKPIVYFFIISIAEDSSATLKYTSLDKCAIK